MSIQRFIIAALAGVCALLASAPAQALSPGRVEFEVFRNGKLEGAHVVDAVATPEGGLRVNVRIDLAGQVGPFSYAYRHRCVESWSAGVLQSIDCQDAERGKPERRVTAERDGAALIVSSPTRASLAGAVLPSSWWNYALARQSRMLDTRTGALTPITVTRVGADTVQTPAGATRATHYRIRGTSEADVWYDEAGRWVKMAFRLRGQRFEYRLKSAPTDAPTWRAAA